ncbi:MAG: Re/Si-specific NAD(P)(+) transhydrogenase subunit alpha [Proteobacteria bacterium]|nr:Re/Si-specific NAD(P)(+) transhydrogenase subunit alpha [Pseudomonadota bacterium]
MLIGIVQETTSNETRVAAVPETVKKLVAMGFRVAVEASAGAHARIPDTEFKTAGAKLVSRDQALASDIILKVRPPSTAEIAKMKGGAVVIGLMQPHASEDIKKKMTASKITSFAMEFVPRITRAQSMDVLSSQANLAGYRAVLESAIVFGRAFPMMMTAAGTVPPVKVLVMGAGVAGLQAIATAKRLGAVVSATDVRPAVKEQVESLGGKFVAVEDKEFKAAETSGGYAKEMSAGYKAKQAKLIAETIPQQDIIITTALIPGRPAPVLVTEAMVKSMRPGSVIVDLAVEQGGNCPLSKADKIIVKHHVSLVGYTNMAGRLPEVASVLYARNLFNFLTNLWDDKAKQLKLASDDEIIQASRFTSPMSQSTATKNK